ncbi:MAG: carbohydrate kinase family protein, partial [Pyrinomonadaceae bacterium]
MRPPFEFRSDTEYDVAGFGTNAVDYLISVPEYPKFNTKIELTSWQMLPGGEVASTLVALQRLGLHTAYAGRFGRDEAGKVGLQSLIDEGVDVEYAQFAEDAQTQVGFIFVDEKTGERTIAWKRDDTLRYSADEAPVDLARSAKILHMTPHDGEAVIAMARAACETGAVVSIDIDNLFDGFEELLKFT